MARPNEFEMATLRDKTGHKSSQQKRASSQHYIQGGYDYELVDGPLDKYECPICLLCLRNPYQTSCGHRFCYTCILTWQSEGMTCPYDKCTLGEGDLFHDSAFEQEIDNLLVKCPLSKVKDGEGARCTKVLTIRQMPSHERECGRRSGGGCGGPEAPRVPDQSTTCPSCGELLDSDTLRAGARHNLICPNAQVACPLASAGCSDLISRADLPDHIHNSGTKHIQLLFEWLLKIQQIQSSQEVVSGAREQRTSSLSRGRGGRGDEAPDAAGLVSDLSGRGDALRMSGSNLHTNQRQMKDLFHRVVALEQRGRQMELLCQSLRSQVRELKAEPRNSKEDEMWEHVGRNCQGKFVWKISNFSDFHDKMRLNHSFVLYSRGFYTNPFGYKFCLRSNIHIINGEEHLGLFVHVMKGDNDDVLSWPFRGKVVLTIKNRETGNSCPGQSGAPDTNGFTHYQLGCGREDLNETMSTPDSAEAFNRASGGLERNPVGYGLQDFVRINAMYTRGLVNRFENLLVIRAHIISSTED